MSRLSDSIDYTFHCTLKRMTIIPLVALGVCAMVLLAMIGFLLWTMSWGAHSNRVIAKGLEVEKLLLDVQTGTRGYYLTGDEAFLAPYNASRRQVVPALAELTALVRDSSDQSTIAKKFRADADEWLAWADLTLSATTHTRDRPTTNTIRDGRTMFDTVRGDVDALLANETSLRDARSRNAMHAAEATIGGTLLALLVLGAWQVRFTRGGLRSTTDRYRQAVDLAERRNEQIKSVVRELDSELRAVAEIQRSLLPLKLPTIPSLRLAASYQTSRRAGGDYYDFFRLPADDSVPVHEAKWGVLIADVSGHGTPAAVLMAVTHAIAHGIERPLDAPSKLLGFVNDRLCDGYTSENAAFVTAFFGIYDPAQRTLEYSSAGHNPPRFLRKNETSFHALDDAQGLPLGVQAGEVYPDARIHLNVGDTLVLYTDGWVEARDAQNELFGVERLEATFNAVAHLTPADMVTHALDTMKRYTADHSPTDDCTLLVLQMTDSDRLESPGVAVVSEDTSVLSEVDAVMAAEADAFQNAPPV